jgi:putative redox protein
MGSIILRQVEHHMLVASDSRGASIVIGLSQDPEFPGLGAKASDLLLMAVASCSAYDVIEILAKQRQEYRDFKVVCTGDQLSEPPYTFTSIHLHFSLRGKIVPEKLENAIQLSVHKYCSVVNTIRPDTPVTHDFEILP